VGDPHPGDDASRYQQAYFFLKLVGWQNCGVALSIFKRNRGSGLLAGVGGGLDDGERLRRRYAEEELDRRGGRERTRSLVVVLLSFSFHDVP